MVVSTNLSCGHLMSSSKLTIAILTLIAYYVYISGICGSQLSARHC